MSTTTSQNHIIAMLKRPEGATITEIVQATSWQPDTAHGFVSGVLKKRLRLPVVAQKVKGRGTVYKLNP
jgi:hypothetical protein